MSTPSNDDRDPTADLLARALRDEADRIETDPAALQRIQRRTAAGPAGLPRHGWTLGALGAGLAAAAVITAVVVVTDDADDDGATTVTSPSETAATPSATAPTSDAVTPMHEGVFDPDSPDDVLLHYVGVGTLTDETGNLQGTAAIYTEPHTVSTPTVLGAVREFLTSTPIDPDYVSGWPAGIDVSDVRINGGGAEIALFGGADIETAPDVFDGDISNEPAAESRAAELAIQGLIRTAGIMDGPVSFTFNGEPVTRLLGVDVAAGVDVLPDQASDFSSTSRAAVQVTSPVEGQVMSNPVLVTGDGNVFEGNVSWLLLDARGEEIDSGFVTTAMGEWLDFQVGLGTLPPGRYTFRAFESSGLDGSEINVDDKTFTVE
jgi:hypothetical protein